MRDLNNQVSVDRFSERELSILRLMADGLSNQEIADRQYLAVTTIKWYIRQINDKLDTHTRTQTVARAHQLKLIGDTDSTKVAQAEAREAPENPYKGLRAFQVSDAADFFGREALVRQLLKRLDEPGPFAHFLTLIGPSGSGKSSVVKAGLIAALSRGELPGSQNWLIAEILPGAQPLEELEVALLRLATNPPPTLLPQLRQDERGLLLAARRVLPDDDHVLVLVIDQFEEVFTLVENRLERQHFLDLLYTAVNDARSPLRVIVTLRADFYDRPLLYARFGELICQRMEAVLPLTVEELTQAITRPAERASVKVEAGLVTAIVAEVNDQPGVLPLLQYALTELFESHQGDTLTLEAYRVSDGVLGALARRADTLYGELDAQKREIARQIFLRLVTLGEGIEDTRRRVFVSELLSLGSDANVIDQIIQTFAAYRLLTLDHDPATRAPTVEVAHEALIREWKRLGAWLDESRVDVRLQRLLASAAAEWEKVGRDAGYLLAGSRLAQFEEWAEQTGLSLTDDERGYLATSLAERKRQEMVEHERQMRERRLERRLRTFLRVLVVVLLLATLGAFGLTGVAVSNEREARSLALASRAQLALNDGSIDLAIQQAQAALEISDNTLARRILDLAAFAPQTPRIFQETEGFIPAVLAPRQANLTFAIVSHFGPEFSGNFGASMVRGMEDACTLLNATCHWLSDPFLDMQPESLQGYWEQALTLNPDGLGTTIPDLIGNGIQQAVERGIPVVVFNTAGSLGVDRSLPAFLYVGSDEYIGGQTNAHRVFVEAKADGVVIQRGVCASQDLEAPFLIAHCAGVASVFDQEGVLLDILSIKTCGVHCEDPPEMEAAHLANYFADHPETNAIFMLGPQPASALNLYIQQVGLKPRQLYATTRDTSPEIFQMIQDGYLLQTVDQQQYMQGFQTIMSLYLYRQYGIRPSGFINTSSVVDRSNVESVIQLVAAGYR